MRLGWSRPSRHVVALVALASFACEGRPKSKPDNGQTDRNSGPALAILDLSEGVPEQTSSSLLDVTKREQTFDELVLRISEIAKDRDITGVFVRFGEASIGLARSEEIGELLEAVRQTGKPVFCHGDSFGNATLNAAARACSKIYLSPAGEVEVVGMAAEIVYLHKLLADELHVSVDIMQVGKFKGAEEPLTRDGPSDEAKESLTETLASMREGWIAGIRTSRGDAAAAAMEDGPYSPPRAKALKLVDEVGYADDARNDARAAAGSVRDLVLFGRGQGQSDDELAEVMRFLTEEEASAPIALVRATGSISMGRDESLLSSSDGITERALGRVLQRLEKNDDVRAVVLRIDSPGGSALASDLLWHRLMKLRAKKPVVVSVGGMAASGGYYLACTGTTIFAEPGSIVGSIGVVGGKLAIGSALAPIGVHTQIFPANPEPTAAARAGYASMFADWDDATRARVLEDMTAVYDLFLSRVAEGRRTDPEKIAPFAEGRIFSGTQAKERGLVDEIGGLAAAFAKARELAKLPADAEIEAIGTAHGVLRALAGARAEVSSAGRIADPSGVLRTSLRRLAPRVAPFALGLVSLTEGETTLTVVPYALVVR